MNRTGVLAVAGCVALCVAGASTTCADEILGWGANVTGQVYYVPAGSDFVQVAPGNLHCLALKSDGSIVGWGWNGFGVATPPAGGTFVAVAAGGHFSLALRADGELFAWGLNALGQTNVPAGNDFVAIAAGLYHGLALRDDGSIVGWGQNTYGQATPPSGSDFVAISTAAYTCLALKEDGSIVGWGANQHGQATPPSGNGFVAISAGFHHGLALKQDGSIVGWGYNFSGQATPPSGNDFTAVSAGNYHSLALKEDGSLLGWGSDIYGLTPPPSGTDFVGVFSGFTNSFALRRSNAPPVADAGDDVTVECTSPAGASVNLDGTGSEDPDYDDITYEWSAAGITFSDAASAEPTATFPIGPTLVTLTVTDGQGGMDVDDVLVMVVDTTPPVALCTTDAIALWPPNHKMVAVVISVEASDACTDPDDVLVTCVVSSSEPDDATGDGEFTGDVDGEDGHTLPVSVELSWSDTAEAWTGVVDLRAERDGSEMGRTYSISCDAQDASGNVATASCVVVVPHDKRSK